VVYEHAPIREDMIERIRVVCRSIPRDVLLKMVRHFENRLVLCIRVNGDNFEVLSIEEFMNF